MNISQAKTLIKSKIFKIIYFIIRNIVYILQVINNFMCKTEALKVTINGYTLYRIVAFIPIYYSGNISDLYNPFLVLYKVTNKAEKDYIYTLFIPGTPNKKLYKIESISTPIFSIVENIAKYIPNML